MNVKKQSTNFNTQEESVLVSLARQRKGVLECKLTDTKTHKEKSECWKQIEEKFNLVSSEVYRPADVLRKKHENLKKRVKPKFADEKCYSQSTGGGPPPKFVFTTTDNELREVLGHRIDGLHSEFGGDADTEIIEEPYSIKEVTTSLSSNFLIPIIEHNYAEVEAIPVVDYDHDTSSVTKSDWSSYSPKSSQKSDALKVSENKSKRSTHSAAERVNQWAEAKSNLEEAKTTFLKEEWELKLQHMKECHQQEMHKRDLEIQWLQDEHCARIEILELEKQFLKAKIKK